MIDTLAVLLIGLFVLLASANAAILLGNLRFDRHRSMLCLLGGLLGAAGFGLLPSLRPLAWVPLLLDPTTAAFLLHGLPRLLHELWQTSRFNLLCTYKGRSGIRVVQLALYQKHVFTLRQTFARPPGEAGLIECSTIGSWRWEDGRLILQNGERTAIFELVSQAPVPALRLCTGFSSYEADPEQSLAGIDLTCDSQAGV